MHVVLLTQSKHRRGQRIHLRVHQVARFGRSDWADYSFADDPSMSDMHFEFRCTTDGCYVRNLSDGGGTRVNGEEITEAAVYSGDQILAGTTRFEVQIEGAAFARPVAADPIADTVSVASTALGLSGLAATCAYLELSRDVRTLSETSLDADQLIDALAAEEKFLDALRIRGFLLPKRDAVWWGCRCVRDELDDELDADQDVALAAAEAWVTEPSETRRREAEAKANAVGSKGPGGLLALSAFWCEGTIGPPEAPDVPADERLVCQGVAAALITAAYAGDATQAKARLTAFLDKGKAVARGKLPIPRASA
jgi:predicted component of type VI protein secretion system